MGCRASITWAVKRHGQAEVFLGLSVVVVIFFVVAAGKAIYNNNDLLSHLEWHHTHPQATVCPWSALEDARKASGR